MENKITLPRLAAMMAEATGKPRRLCEDFLRELFALCAESLSAGENVKIKGFGTFKLSPVDARKSVNVATGDDIRLEPHMKITFIASKELAASVNAPFEMFESVEVADTFSISADTASAQPGPPVEEVAGEPSVEKKAVIEEKAVIVDKPVADERPIAEKQSVVSEETPVAEERVAIGESVSDSRSDSFEELDADEVPGKRGFRFGWGFFAGFISAVLIGGVVVYLFGFTSLLDRQAPQEAASASEPAPVAVAAGADTVAKPVGCDSLAAVAPIATSDSVSGEMVGTQASDQPVYDTISHTRYLTTMAKEHYGNFNLWPYIYKENEKILGHPDRIRPGTRVVVPPLSKYGVDPANPAHIRKAKQMGTEIYSRYK